MRLPLSPLDRLFVGRKAPPGHFALRFEQPVDYDRLALGLADVLDSFPYLCGTLERDEIDYHIRVGRGRPQLEHRQLSSAPMSLRECLASVDPATSTLGGPTMRAVLVSWPGGAAIVVSASHAVVDGFSYFLFLSTWAGVCRGDNVSPISHERAPLEPSGEAPADLPAAIATLQKAMGVYVGASSPSEVVQHDIELPRRSDERHETLALDVADHFKGALHPLSSIGSAVDVRRIEGRLPPNYFGNAIVVATAEVGACERKRAEEAVRSAVDAVDEGQLDAALSAAQRLWELGGAEILEHIRVASPRGLLVTNIGRHARRALDFGWGAPTDMAGLTDEPRVAIVYPFANRLRATVTVDERRSRVLERTSA